MYWWAVAVGLHCIPYSARPLDDGEKGRCSIQTDVTFIITGAIHKARPINSDDLLCAGHCGAGFTGGACEPKEK